MAPKLIIFDCDGTLVDSELLYNTVTSEILNEMGFNEYTPELCIELFGGQSWGTIKAALEEKHAQAIPRDIIDRYIKITNARMDDLKTPEDAHHVVEKVKTSVTICVASNGERNNVIKSLRVTKLYDHFDEENIFTKIQVERPKPAPDLFLFAAEQMGFAPDQCLVIEDSPAGVTAAKGANMQVIGFIGTAHDPNAQQKLLENAGADHITDRLIHILDHI